MACIDPCWPPAYPGCCSAHSAGELIPKLNAVMAPKTWFVLNFKNCSFIKAFNEVNAQIPQRISWRREIVPIASMLRGRPSCCFLPDLKAHFAHLFQEKLSSTINLHLNRFRRDSEQSSCLGMAEPFQCG